MSSQTLPYLLVYITAFTISILVFVYSWRNRSTPGVQAFTISVALEISWLVGYVFEINSSSLEAKVFWDNFQYIGALYAPIALLIFALGFTGRKVNTRRLSIALGLFPTFILTAIFANIKPELIRFDAQIIPGIPYDELTYSFGTLTNLGNYFLYLLSLAYIIVLATGFGRKKRNFRTQLWLVLTGTGIPIVGLLLAQFLGWKFANQRDVSPLFFAVSNAVIAFGIFRFRIFNILPIAREALFGTIEDVLIILDAENVIVDANPAARRFLSAAGLEPIGVSIRAVFPELYEQFGDVTEIQTEISGEGGVVFDLRITPLYDRSKRYIGRLISAHDISRQKRTEKELQETGIENAERAELFQNVVEVSRIITSIQDFSTLLSNLPQIISNHFDVYHVGIFLLDPKGEMAILQAANSEGGKRMLARRHQLQVGSESLVGYVTSTGVARIAQNVVEDDIHYRNPDLPETQSELTIPLKIAGTVIGALDLQTKEINAFDELEVRVGMLLADMIAIAFQNARLHEENIAALEEAEKASRQLTGEAWGKVFKTNSLKGYVFDGVDSQLLSQPQNDHSVSIPVQIRGYRIGALKLSALEEGREWNDDELDIITAAAERAALALESARLLEDAQRRATRERIIGDISASISTSSDIEGILRTAVQVLGRRMGGAEVILELGADVNNKEVAKK